MMNKKILSLGYIQSQGLHDSVLDVFEINFRNNKILIIISELFKKKNGKIIIELNKIRFLNIDQENDFKNREIILDFEINLDRKQIKIFTTSNTLYNIGFEESNVTLEY